MKSRRRTHRFRVLALLGIGLALALASFWLLQLMHHGVVDNAPEVLNNEPDYYVEKFNYVRTARAGDTRYTVSGARMIHRPKDDTFEITLPVVHSLSTGQPPLMMRAERALAVPDSSKITMQDHVEIDRPASPTNVHFHLRSDTLLILPDEDVVQTDRPVDLVLGTAHLTGVGMYVNNATREFRLAQRVHGVYPPRALVAVAPEVAPAAPAAPAARTSSVAQ